MSVFESAAAAAIPCAAVVELTRRCNLECRHCYAVRDAARAELGGDEIRRVLGELRDLGTLFVTFTGGEPTVRPDFLDLLRHASDLRFAVQFFSNGVRIDDAAADALASMRLFHAGLSVYGATAETHDRVTRRPGSFAGTLAAARRLRDRGAHAALRFVAMDLNAGEYGAVKALAAEEGLPLKTETLITARDDMDREPLSLAAAEADVRCILSEGA
ncbi:MAG: radical SAM protein, partial [Planctomycetota bacterium]